MKTSRRDLWQMVALTFAGTVLRIADLTGRSMWVDEGITLTRVFGSWPDMFRNIVILQGIHTVDLHPWFYFALTKLWGMAGGDYEFVLKLIPAFASLLLIPATYALAHQMFGRRAAYIAALLALTSPAYQWYGHELRMYPLVALLAVLSGYLVFRRVNAKRTSSALWVFWIAVSSVSVLTHYSLVVVAGAQMLFVLVIVLRSHPRVTRREMIMLAGFLATVIGAGIMIGVASDVRLRISQFLSGLSTFQLDWLHPAAIIYNVVNTMLFGMNASDPTNGPFIWFVVAVIAAGLALPLNAADQTGKRKSTSRQRLFIVMLSVLPIGLVSVLTLTIEHQPSFRYSIAVVPMLQVMLAQVFSTALSFRPHLLDTLHTWRPRLSTILKGLGIIAAGTVFAAQFFGLAFTFIRTPSWQDDWRGMAQYIRNNWQDGDVVIINLLTPYDALKYYLGDLPVQIVPEATIPLDDAARKQFLSDYRRVWYVNAGGDMPYADTGAGRLLAPINRRLLIHFPSQTNILALMLFDLTSPFPVALPPAARVIQANPSGAADPQMVAYELMPGNPYNEHPNARLSLYWRRPTGSFSPSAYSLAVRFVDTQHQDWADWFMPANLVDDPKEWSADQLLRVDYIIPLPLGLPRQKYQLELTLTKGDKAEVVRSVSDSLDLSQVDCCVRIIRWTAAGSPASVQTTVWHAAGADVSAVEFPTTIYPGKVLPVILTWQLTRRPSSDWQTVLHLDGLLGGMVVEAASPTGTREPPLSSWPVGQPMRSIHALQLPYTIQPGFYRLSLTREFTGGQHTDGFLLGIVQVQDYPPSPVAQNIPVAVHGSAGDLTLLGYSLNQPFVRNATLQFELYWKVQMQPKGDGVLFLHVMDPHGVMVAQDDNPPEQGARSTLTYRPGDGINQIYRLVIPAGAPGGTYTLYAGVYDRLTKERWPAQQNGKPAKDELLYLGTLNLPDLPRKYHNYIPMVMRGH